MIKTVTKIVRKINELKILKQVFMGEKNKVKM